MTTLYNCTQNVKGGVFRDTKIGRNIVKTEDNIWIVSVDNYKGQGDTFKQRDEPKIKIYDNDPDRNEDVIFEGTHAQLIELLKKNL